MAGLLCTSTLRRWREGARIAWLGVETRKSKCNVLELGIIVPLTGLPVLFRFVFLFSFSLQLTGIILSSCMIRLVEY